MTEHKTYWFYFADTEGGEPIIRIKNKRKPSVTTIPWGGCWGLQEMYEGKWQMPCFPQITWGRLKQMHFIKKEPAVSKTETVAA